jgi:16S rRNA (guanine527-N7)-methyltransferase
MTLAPALAGGIRTLGVDVGPSGQAQLLAYIALLQKWNRTHNLTAIRTAEQMLTHHILDSLAVVPHVPSENSTTVVDIGSGGGLPGIPIAVARPGWRVTLLDSNQKKAAFLRQAVAELTLRNADVVARRAENFDPQPRFDVAISRAYSNLTDFVAQARRLTRPHGIWLAMKGIYPADELAELPPEVSTIAVSRLTVPGLDAERHLVVMRAA